MAKEYAQELRSIMSQKEGGGIDEALYKYATKEPSDAEPLALESWSELLDAFHAAKVDDQFVPPVVALDDDNKPLSLVAENDFLIYYDYRTDRAKPLTAAFLGREYGGQQGGLSDKAQQPKNVHMCTMTHYDDAFSGSDQLSEAFNPAEPLKDTYAEILGKEGIAQLICAESEKWRAVTWFKDGRRNLGYESDSKDGIITTEKHESLPITVRIAESRQVSAHIEAPQMRAKEIADLLVQGVEDEVPDIFANFANADMVAHAMTDSDRFEDVVEGLLRLDEALERVVKAALEKEYVVFVTGDHGNAEEMFVDDSKKAMPSHTTNKVPFVVLGLSEKERDGLSLDENLTIGDIGPCCLQLRGLEAPDAWDRTSAFEGGNIEGKKERRIMRLVLDGYGVREEKHGNAMASAAEKRDGKLLCVERWMKGEEDAVFAAAEASGEECGYPEGQAGTTEFGHVLFDAGRTVRSDLTLIDHAIESGKFADNEALKAAAEAAKEKDGPALHIMGILSDGKVHASLDHLDAILELVAKVGVPADKVNIHAITDGRDVAGDSSPKYIEWLFKAFERHQVGRLVSLFGRAWGKDRDNRWKRIESAYRSLCEGTAAVHVKIAKKDK